MVLKLTKEVAGLWLRDVPLLAGWEWGWTGSRPSSETPRLDWCLLGGGSFQGEQDIYELAEDTRHEVMHSNNGFYGGCDFGSDYCGGSHRRVSDSYVGAYYRFGADWVWFSFPTPIPLIILASLSHLKEICQANMFHSPTYVVSQHTRFLFGNFYGIMSI